MKREVIALVKLRTRGFTMEKIERNLNHSNDIVDNHNKIRVIAASTCADENDSYSDLIYQ